MHSGSRHWSSVSVQLSTVCLGWRGNRRCSMLFEWFPSWSHILILSYYCSRSPGHRVPWWVLIWIKRSPLVFLVLSVACFSVGLCCFAYASDQVSSCSYHRFMCFEISDLFSGQSYLHINDRLDCIYILWPSCSVRMVRIWEMDILPT